MKLTSVLVLWSLHLLPAGGLGLSSSSPGRPLPEPRVARTSVQPTFDSPLVGDPSRGTFGASLLAEDDEELDDERDPLAADRLPLPGRLERDEMRSFARTTSGPPVSSARLFVLRC
jgi:hypothetical protein